MVMKQMLKVFLVAMVAVSMSACSITDDGDTAPAGNKDNKGNNNGVVPAEVKDLVGTWDYKAVISNGQQYEATGFLTLNADLTFAEEFSVKGGEVRKSEGTYSVKGNEVTVKTKDGEDLVVSYQIAEAEKDGVKKPSLVIDGVANGAPFRSILVKR